MENAWRRNEGFTYVELLAGVGILAVLMAIAIPMLIGHQNGTHDISAKTEVRQALVPLQVVRLEAPETDPEVAIGEFSPSVSFDGTAVLGVNLQQATDGSTCLWKMSETGTVFGVWDPKLGSALPTLYATKDALPADCPGEADVVDAGFSPTGW